MPRLAYAPSPLRAPGVRGGRATGAGDAQAAAMPVRSGCTRPTVPRARAGSWPIRADRRSWCGIVCDRVAKRLLIAGSVGHVAPARGQSATSSAASSRTASTSRRAARSSRSGWRCSCSAPARWWGPRRGRARTGSRARARRRRAREQRSSLLTRAPAAGRRARASARPRHTRLAVSGSASVTSTSWSAQPQRGARRRRVEPGAAVEHQRAGELAQAREQVR